MHRFVLRENIRRYKLLLESDRVDQDRIELMRLMRAAQAELDALESASTHAVTQHDAVLRVFAETAIDSALQHQSAQFGTLHIYDEPSETLIIMAQRNLTLPLLDRFNHIDRADGSTIGRCLRTGDMSVIENVAEDGDFAPDDDPPHELGVGAMQSTPLHNGEGEPALIFSTFFSAPHRFPPHDRADIERRTKLLARSLVPMVEEAWSSEREMLARLRQQS